MHSKLVERRLFAGRHWPGSAPGRCTSPQGRLACCGACGQAPPQRCCERAAQGGRSESERLNTEETQRGIESQRRRAPKGVRALGGRGGDPGESGIQGSGHDEQEYKENHKLSEAGGPRPSWSPCSRRRKRRRGRRRSRTSRTPRP